MQYNQRITDIEKVKEGDTIVDGHGLIYEIEFKLVTGPPLHCLLVIKDAGYRIPTNLLKDAMMSGNTRVYRNFRWEEWQNTWQDLDKLQYGMGQ